MGVAREPHVQERSGERRDPLLGEVFDQRFRVEARIAAGGFGAIYRATHTTSGRQLALKILHPTLTRDPRVVARFRREGDTLTRLLNKHTITAYELGETDNGMLYIVMELLHGESLYDRFRSQGPMPWQQAIAIGRAVCDSLREAHEMGIIHRDLKPTNIHLETRGNQRDFVKVLDFGIAKILQGSEIDSTELTHAGQMIGTLDYMSPEQMVGSACNATCDIYTLGIVMYEIIAGRKPFDDANSAAAALTVALTTTPVRLGLRAVVPPEVDRIVMRCLERQYTDRFQSAAELAQAIDNFLIESDEVETRMSAAAGAAKASGSRPSRPSVVQPAPPAQAAAKSAAQTAPKSAPVPAQVHGGVVATIRGAVPIPVPALAFDHAPTMNAGPNRLGFPAVGSRPGDAANAPTRNLRDAYPQLQRSLPSPMQPPQPLRARPQPTGSYDRRRVPYRDTSPPVVGQGTRAMAAEPAERPSLRSARGEPSRPRDAEGTRDVRDGENVVVINRSALMFAFALGVVVVLLIAMLS